MTIIENRTPCSGSPNKKMKLEYEDGVSNHSDFSNDSQNSQISTSTDFITTIVTSTYLQTSASSFLTLEGLNSGVPTRTTPTLTPTTLRNIEQTFSELQPKTESHENEAGFVPPLVHSIGNNQYISASDVDVYSNKSTQSLWQNSLSQSSSDCDTRSTPPPLLNNKTSFSNTIHPATTTSSSGSSTTSSPNQTRRNMGGRKPAKDLNISPEEEERRRIRRERNKAAAARCRKRRVDHTNSLIKETEELESKRQALQDELQDLTMIRDELEYILKQHRSSSNCRVQTGSPPDVKPFVNNEQNNTTNTIFNHQQHQQQHQQQQQQHHQQRCNGGGGGGEDRVKTEYIESMEPMYDDSMFLLPSSPNKKIMLSSTVAITKPLRPNSLNVGATAPHLKQTASEIAGLQVTTPSNGMMFNYESLMLGGTGLTPVATCSTQQRNIPVSIADLSSPDACGPPKLVSL